MECGVAVDERSVRVQMTDFCVVVVDAGLRGVGDGGAMLASFL